MTPGARVAAAIEILGRWQAGEAGLDRVLTAWGRANRFAGAGDRRAIADLAYDALRRRRSGAWVAGRPDDPEPRTWAIGSLCLDGLDPGRFFTGEGHAPPPLTAGEGARLPLEEAPEAVRLDLPDWLMPHLAGVPAAALDRLRTRAGLHLRVNALKADPATAIAALTEDGVTAVPGPLCATCLAVTGGARRVERSRAYAQGLVEIQDAASQAVAEMARARPGESVLDLCAGAGGKTLALAAAMGGPEAGGGRLIAHDTAPKRLAQLAPRAARAGARIETRAPGALEDLAAACDLVVVDAPCSGSGAWARNPDAKWRLTPGGLEGFCDLQTAVLERGAACVRPGGRLLYATCSLIEAENAARTRAFLARTPGFARLDERQWTPLDGGDGFYACLLGRG